MSPINYDALRTGVDTAVQVPEDGKHQAQLTRGKLVDTKNGERLVTEWFDPAREISWDSWNRFDATGLSFTRDLLTGLGIDLNSIMNDDALADALEAAENRVYDVKTQSSQGSGGDRWFTNTYVDGAALGVQTVVTDDQLSRTEDVPIDTDGLPDVTPNPDLDTIPF